MPTTIDVNGVFEFLVPARPLSHQAKNNKHRRQWRDFVFGRAYAEWQGLPIADRALRFTMVYICEEDPADINNLIKPVQDALIGLVYTDDNLITDVQGHLRMTTDLLEVSSLPPLLREAIFHGTDCVYIRIDESKPLDTIL